MILNYVNTGLFTAVVLVSAVYNLKVNTRESNPRRMLTQIVQNISRVQNVLERFIKHFEQVEGTAEDSDQTAEVVSEVKNIFDEIAKPAEKLHKSKKSNKGKTRKHGNNNDEIDNNSTFKFKTLEVREFTMNTSRNNQADEIVRGHRRVNENPNDEKEYVPIDLQKKNKNEINASIDENVPTTSDKAPQTTHKPEISAVHVHDSSAEEEQKAQDEILKAKSLRQAYDEACKTVIKRKCNKALETVLKDVCDPNRRKCTGKFKADFKSNGKTGCDTQFNEKAAICRMGYDYPEIAEPDINADNTKLLRAKTQQYEKACNKANYTKCLAACKYAVDETCGEHECVKSKQKAFDKSCQRRCKENYGISDSDSSSDSISDDGDSVGWDSV